MPAPSSSLVLLLTFAASLPSRLGAAWLAFASYDAGAGQSPPESQPDPGTLCHSRGEVEEVPGEQAAVAPAEPEAQPDAPAPQPTDLSTFESQALAAHLEENAAWIDEIDTPQWRRSPWRTKFLSVMHAAARGALITSICCDRRVPRDSVSIKTALNLLAHEMNHPMAAYSDGDNADAAEHLN